MRISKRVVDAAGPAEDGSRRIIWDSALPGFGLLVLPSGVKSFLYQYRTREGRQRRATIGKVGTLTPEQARQIAEGMSAAVKAGGDPLEAKAVARDAITMGELFDLYLASETFAKKADSTRAIDRGRINRHLRPLVGRHYPDRVTAEIVLKLFRDISAGKTAKVEKTRARGRAVVKGGEGTARAAMRLLSAVFTWARAQRPPYAPANPVEGLSFGSDGQRETILESADDYARLFQTLDRLERETRVRGPVADAIRVIALTGARRGEVAGLVWRHVDLKSGRIVLPPGRHKTGGRTGKPRIITLPSAAQTIIARQPAGQPDDLVFAPAKGEAGGPAALSKPWRLIRQEAGLPEGIGLHGLRHSLASLLAMSGAEASQIMEALGHRQLSTSQRYVHFADKARAALAERAAAPVLAGLAAASGLEPAAVVPLKAKK